MSKSQTTINLKKVHSFLDFDTHYLKMHSSMTVPHWSFLLHESQVPKKYSSYFDGIYQKKTISSF